MNALLTAIGVAAAAAAAGLLAWGNRAITTSEYRIISPKLPNAFEGFRIAQVSDLHNDPFGREYCNLAAAVKAAQPHIIAITGDMLDARRTNIPRALEAARQLLTIAPCYYVKGNHEARNPRYAEFEAGLRNLGVTVLRCENLPLEHHGARITLMGIDCPYGDEDYPAYLHTLAKEAEGFTLLLAHHPEQFERYCESGIDLALCGHTHGGQLRLPFIGGVIAPHQGFFPKYDAGLYEQGNTKMIISRGLGNSLFPLRINNRPELVVVELGRK